MGTRATALHSQFDCRAQCRRSLWNNRTMMKNFTMAATEGSNEMITHGPVPGHLAWWNRTVSLHRRESTDQLLKQESTTHHATLFTQIIDVKCKKRTKLTRVASRVTAACAALCKGLGVWLVHLIYMNTISFPRYYFPFLCFHMPLARATLNIKSRWLLFLGSRKPILTRCLYTSRPANSFISTPIFLDFPHIAQNINDSPTLYLYRLGPGSKPAVTLSPFPACFRIWYWFLQKVVYSVWNWEIELKRKTGIFHK